jgi:hypothetical protein
MNTYKVTGVENTTFSKDRSSASLVLATTKGKVTLSIRSKHLDQLVARLDDLILDAPSDASDQESPVRIEMVDGYKVGRGVVDGVPYVTVALGLGPGGTPRWYALNGTTAGALQQALVAEIPKLVPEPDAER